MRTLLLDQTTWDLVIDASGDIAVASDPYSVAQDAASAMRTFLGEVYYDTTQGVPYWQQILGQGPPLSLVKAKLVAAALTVPDTAAARCVISSFESRVVSGQVQITTSSGQQQVAAF
jgi:hypothetical protein